MKTVKAPKCTRSRHRWRTVAIVGYWPTQWCPNCGCLRTFDENGNPEHEEPKG